MGIETYLLANLSKYNQQEDLSNIDPFFNWEINSQLKSLSSLQKNHNFTLAAALALEGLNQCFI